MANIRTLNNQWETSVSIENEEGRIEAVITHLPGSEPLFTLAGIEMDEDGNPIVHELLSFPVDAA